VKYGATIYSCHTALDTCCCEVQSSGNKNQSKKFKEPAESTNHFFGIENKKGHIGITEKKLMMSLSQ
jgi:hypothetical protein